MSIIFDNSSPDKIAVKYSEILISCRNYHLYLAVESVTFLTRRTLDHWNKGQSQAFWCVRVMFFTVTFLAPFITATLTQTSVLLTETESNTRMIQEPWHQTRLKKKEKKAVYFAFAFNQCLQSSTLKYLASFTSTNSQIAS